MNDLSELRQWSAGRCIGVPVPRSARGRWRALLGGMRSVHRKGKQEFVFNQIPDRQHVVLDANHFAAPVLPSGLRVATGDEHVDRGIEPGFERLEASLTGQPDRNLQAAVHPDKTRPVVPELQVHAHRPRCVIHRLHETVKPVDGQRSAQVLFPGGEEIQIAMSRQHKRLMLLRSKTRCQSGAGVGIRMERIHSARCRKLEIAPVDIVLASSSPYRRELLSRLGIPFDTVSPDIDESPMQDESPRTMVERLARQKARVAASIHPRALIVGSDQAAVLDERIMGKPGNHDANVRQLKLAAGRRVRFLTGVALLNAASGRMQCEVVEYGVHFRALDEAQAEAYVRAEKPYDCAGGFRAEGLGIALFRRMEGEDPSALIGLPLIALVSMLRREGVDPLVEARRS